MAARTYEEFDNEAAEQVKNDNIVNTLGHNYREPRLHPTNGKCIGVVDDTLRDACSEMTAEDRADHYDNDVSESAAEALGYVFYLSQEETENP